jgi:hypothetical protein
MSQELYNKILEYFNKLGLNLNADFTHEHLKNLIVEARKLDY